MNAIDIQGIARRTAYEADGQVRHAARARSFSIRELINSRLKYPLWTSSQRAMDANSEASEMCRQHSGQAPSGTWVPLASLVQTRDLTATGNSQITTGLIGDKLQESLAEESAVMASATILSGLSGNSFSLPIVANALDASGNWLAEGSVGTPKQPTIGHALMTPKELIFTIPVSRRLMLQSSIDVEFELRGEILRAVMREIDRAALVGTGVDTPTGLLNNGNLEILSAGANGLAPTWAHMVEAEYQVSKRTNSIRKPGYLTSPALRKKLRTTQRAAGLDFILPTDGDTLLGHSLLASPLVPDNLVKGTSGAACSALIYGDLSEIYVGFWGPLAVDILIDSVSRAHEGLINMIVRCDVAVTVRNIGAFTAYKDLLSA